jgi:hypothetical protein
MNEPPNQPVTQRRFKWRRVLIAFAVLAAIYAGYRLTLRGMIEAKLHAIREQGYPVTKAELERWSQLHANSTNVADGLVEASQRLVDFKDKKKDDLLPIVGLGSLPKATDPLSNDVKAVVAEYIALNSEALKLIHEAARGKHYRLGEFLKRTGPTRQAERLLCLEAVLHAENRETAETTDSLTSAIALGQLLADDPTVIALLMRDACDGLMLWTLNWTLNRIVFSPAQIDLLSAKLAEAEAPESLSRALVTEWASIEETFALPVRERFSALTVWQEDTQKSGLAEILIYEFGGVKEIDHLRSIDLVAECVAAAKLPSPDRYRTARALEARLGNWCPLFLNSRGCAFLPNVINHDGIRVARSRVALVVLAVEKQRIETGELPDQLDAGLPLDPFTGQPLRYKKRTQGYIVYSVGKDGVDDGGDDKKDITFTVER